MSEPSWSDQQQIIFKEFANPDGHVVIDALAGTGKTTTIVEGGKYAPERSKLYCAFNKRIEQELGMRLRDVRGAESKTFHSLGFGFVREAVPGIKLDTKGEREKWLTNEVCPLATPDVIKRMITKLHTKAREIAPHARISHQLEDLAYQFECVPDNGWLASGWDLEFVTLKAIEAMELASRTASGPKGIDFADMIFLPVRNRWLVKSRDLVLVDETQDMNFAQLEMAQGICRGRLILVGDRNQAIYGFRGADTESMDRLHRELKAKRLKLTRTYRCGKRIVEVAQGYVPEFEAGPNNPDGEVSTIGYGKLVGMAEEGDFILSRLNAPLASVAMALLRDQKRARIAGKDIGQGLKVLIRKLSGRSIPDLLSKLQNWEEKQILRLTVAGKETQIDLIRDQAETIVALAQDAKSVGELEMSIDALFTDDGLGQKSVITCSSVHRAKGLEADRVFVLKDTLRDTNQEERNIAYVSVTRAKSHLVWVLGRR